MKSWINVGSSKGGSWMTLTEEFPIATLIRLPKVLLSP